MDLWQQEHAAVFAKTAAIQLASRRLRYLSSAASSVCIRQHTSGYVSIRQLKASDPFFPPVRRLRKKKLAKVRKAAGSV